MQLHHLLAEARAHSEAAAADAPLLLAHLLDKPVTWIYAHPEEAVSAPQAERFRQLLARRGAGEPLAYLTGEKDFWSLTLKVTPATLVPRPETELLVEVGLELGDFLRPPHPSPLPKGEEATLPSPSGRGAGGEGITILDLGTGSGAIALAIAHERPRWQVTATDLSAEALAVAKENARKLGLKNLRFLQGRWYDPLPANARFQLILSNPPYVAENDPHLQGDGVRHEPRAALTAGPEGLDELRTIVRGAPAHLDPGGWLAVEHGAEQGQAVQALFQEAGFEKVETRRDLAGNDRVTLGCYA